MSKHLKSRELYGPLMPGTLVSDKIVAATLGIGRTKVWLLAKEGLLQRSKSSLLTENPNGFKHFLAYNGTLRAALQLPRWPE
jgi:hypothetical protein